MPEQCPSSLSETSPPNDPEPWEQDPPWTIDEVAQYLKLTPDTIRKMVRAGTIKAIKLGKEWRIKKSALQHLLRDQE